MVKFTLFLGGGSARFPGAGMTLKGHSLLIGHRSQVIIEGIRLPISVAIWVQL